MQTEIQAVEMIVSVMRDGRRSDRYLRRADDGHYYISPDKTFLGNDGPYTPPYVKIGVSTGELDEEQEDIVAESYIEELDMLCGEK